MRQHTYLAFLSTLLAAILLAGCTNKPAQTTAAKSSATEGGGVVESSAPVDLSKLPGAPFDANVVAMIRDEGMNRSQVMDTLLYLTDVLGPRLTGSPELKRANIWTRDRLTSWGLSNAHLEAWGPFGRGWTLERYSAEIIDPVSFPLISFPKAWSPGLAKEVVAEVVWLDPQTEDEMKKWEGKLEDKIVFIGPIKPVKPHFEAKASRLSDDELKKMAEARANQPRSPLAPGASTRPMLRDAQGPGTRPSSPDENTAKPDTATVFTFAFKQKAALIATASSQGDGGTYYTQSATAPGSAVRNFTRTRVWSKDSPEIPPQITVAIEQFNRVVRMVQAGQTVKMAVNLKVTFHDDDEMAYNTIAEIPGTDLKDEIVMIGAHIDSWQSGTGASDNAAGCAAVMEAVRIIKALDLKPRRTIRIGLWSGEEQGLYGSSEYVSKHLGTVEGGRNAFGGFGAGGRRRGQNADGDPTTNPSDGPATRPAGRGDLAGPTSRPTTRPMKLNKGPEYDKFSVYFNLDNGLGRIRGIYLQQNGQCRRIFQEWLAPFADLGAQTVTISNTGGTDHQSFDGIGLPGFQFIQDPLEYGTRTHHSNMDVFDRAIEDDMKQSATIMATFIYNAAMMDQKMPRKPFPPPQQDGPRGPRPQQQASSN